MLVYSFSTQVFILMAENSSVEVLWFGEQELWSNMISNPISLPCLAVLDTSRWVLTAV